MTFMQFPLRRGETRRERVRPGFVGGLLVLVLAGVFWGPELVRGGHEQHVDPIARFLLAVAVIVLTSHLLGSLLQRWGQPAVIGEILGGLLLGPSALGLALPGMESWLFPAQVQSTLGLAAQLGLATFMFLLGCELRVDQVRGGMRSVGAVVAGGMGLPFVTGVALALGARGTLGGTGSLLTYALFFGLAVSITAMPVLARILVDLKLDRGPLGALALAGAAVGDGVAWAALTLLIVLGGVGAGGAQSAATVAGMTVALLTVTVLCVRPALARLVRASERRGAEGLLLPVLLAGALGYAALTQLIGLHPVIGAFAFGTVVPRSCAPVERVRHQLQGFTLAVLLPLFFAGVGLSVSVSSLGTEPEHWLILAAVLVLATVSKVAGVGGVARMIGLPGRDAARLGVLMNCRGVTELVVAQIGWQYHLISTRGLTVLVLMALITTALTGPVLRFLRPQRRFAVPDAVPDTVSDTVPDTVGTLQKTEA